MEKILVTGGAGFIGSNFIEYILDKYKNYHIVNVDDLTYAGDLKNLKNTENNKRYSFHKGNITDKIFIEKVFKEYNFKYIVNFAAESHVDKSIQDPELFLKTNVIGTHILISTAKEDWKEEIDTQKEHFSYKKGVKFIQISTDEVYGDLKKDEEFYETTSLNPSSPYSASKASADMIVRAYSKTYNFPVNIIRSCNNYGPKQNKEKLVPLVINNAIKNKEIPVYGDGLQIRDWIYVFDFCRAIDKVMHKGNEGEIYNVGANNQIKNIEMIKLILENLNKKEELIKHIKDRPGHDRRYAVNNNKIKKELEWRPKYNFEESLIKTIKWFVNKENK